MRTSERYTRRYSILIVDDQPISIQGLAHLLETDYTVQVAASGAKAIEIATGSAPPDLILMDVMMPDMDGYEVCRRLKGNSVTRPIPIIFVTGKDSTDDEEKGFDLGAEDYISKPFKPGVVRARVQARIERLRIEEALRYAGMFQRELLDNLPAGVVLVNPESRRIEQVNAHAVMLYGAAASELVGEYCHESLCVNASAGCAVCDHGKLFDHSESMIKRVDGSRLPVLKTVKRISLGGHEKLMICFVDLSEQKRVENELIKVKRAIEQSPATVVITDLDGAIEYANPQFERTTGYTLQEAMGQNPRILKSGEMSPNAYQELWDLLKAGKEWHGEFHNRRKDGTLYWESAVISPVRDADGTVTHYLAVKENITAIKQAAADLQVMNRELEDAVDRANAMALDAEMANMAKSEFLANMSHEIRTPMNGVIGMTGMLLETSLSDEQRRYARVVKSSAEALLELINDILDFSKIEAGKMHLESIDFDVYELVEHLAMGLEIRAREKQISFINDIDSTVPRHLRGDPTRLRQILTNLAGNAIKFTSKGSVTVKLSVAEWSKESGSDASCDGLVPGEQASGECVVIRFSVRDTGIGIPEEKQHLLFEKFSQVDGSTTREYGGTGLGLAISRQLVELMEGEIDFASQVGEGTEFWFKIAFQLGKKAFCKDDSQTTVQSQQSDQQRVDSDAFAGARVLAAEDNLVNQQVLQAILSRYGIVPILVENGQQALDALARDPYDLVFMDVQMPLLDGLATTRRIRAGGEQGELPTEIPIIAMTAHAMDGDSEKCLGAGMNDYLPKPISPEGVFSMLRKWLPENALDARTTRVAGSGAPLPDVPFARNDQTETDVWQSNELVERVGGDVSLAHIVGQAFVDSFQDYYDPLVSDAADADVFERMGHSLKGSSANIGAEKIRVIAAEIERLGRAGKTEQASQLVPAIKHAFDRFRQTFEDWAAGGLDD